MKVSGVLLASLAAALVASAPASGAALTAVERDELRVYPHALVLARTPKAQAAVRAAGGVRIARSLPVWRLSGRAALRVAPLAETLVPDRFIPAGSHVTDPLVGQQWWVPAMRVDAVEPPGPGKPVTVIDTGVDVAHEEFAGRPSTTYLDTQLVTGASEEHGTAVSSTIAAPTNGKGLVGIYPQANLQVWDATPNGPGIQSSEVIAGLDAAIRRGPSVINLSLGSPFRDPLLEAMVNVAFGTGSLVVAAAGNERHRGNPLEYPASYPHVLTVGATDQGGGSTFFSSASPWVDVVAPGMSIPVAVPGNTYASFSGTSFAAPLTAGVAAWAWTLRPALDVTQLFDLMRLAAQDIERPGFDPTSGFGRVDVPSVLAARELPADAEEPNEDLAHILPNKLFRQGAPPLNRPARRNGSLRARLDSAEDPRDVYRVWVPGRRVTALSLSASVDLNLALWGPQTRSVLEGGIVRRRDLKKVSARRGARGEAIRFRNTSRRGAYYFADVTVGSGARAIRQVGRLSYRLSVSSAPIRTKRARR